MNEVTEKYNKGQLVLHGNRIVITSKEDHLLILGHRSVGISSPGSVHINTSGNLHINANKIELGLQAEKVGEPVLLGSKTVENLAKLVDSLEDLSTALISLSETQLESAIPKIVTTATILQKLCPRIKDGFIKSLSNKTYTL